MNLQIEAVMKVHVTELAWVFFLYLCGDDG